MDCLIALMKVSLQQLFALLVKTPTKIIALQSSAQSIFPTVIQLSVIHLRVHLHQLLALIVQSLLVSIFQGRHFHPIDQ